MIEDMHVKPTATIRLKREEIEEEKKMNRLVITSIIQHPRGSLAEALPHEQNMRKRRDRIIIRSP